MSFSSETKAELCRVQVNTKCCALAESYGILLYCNTFSNEQVKIVTESRELAKRLPKVFKKAFGFGFDTVPEQTETAGKLVFIIDGVEKITRIFNAYGYERGKTLAHHINYGVLENECCRQSFARGAFLAGGSITDPGKQYHLEMVTDHYNVSREIYALIRELGFMPKSASRGGNYITYFKSSSAIEDFLTTIGAPLAAMEIMSAKIMKDMTNSVNRVVNCDTANATKIVDAATEQVNAIRLLEQSGRLNGLPEKLRMTAMLRLANPELSLSQLAAISDPVVTKSCLNHRLRKLVEMAKK